MTAQTPLIQEELYEIESLMRAQASGQHPDLASALDLLLSAGGKRIRPTITVLIGRALGAPQQKLITLGAAIELLHTATLVHDDLIDGALLRRGTPTLNSKWSPAATVLTGDFLFACAAKLAADTGSLAAMSMFSRTLQTIVNGEISQLFTNRCLPNREEYFKRIYAKTASLFETCAATAAMVANCGDQMINPAAAFGYQVGVAFQIIDDILDFTEAPETLGKPTGSDLRQGIVTLPVIAFIENNPNHPLSQKLSAGECFDSQNEVESFINRIKTSDAIEKARDEARAHLVEGLKKLSYLPQTEEILYLTEIVGKMVDRKV